MTEYQQVAALFYLGLLCIVALLAVGLAGVLSILARDPDVARDIQRLVERVL